MIKILKKYWNKLFGTETYDYISAHERRMERWAIPPVPYLWKVRNDDY